jgi:hypothetical protein
MGRSTVIINGKAYDAISGLAIEEEKVAVRVAKPAKSRTKQERLAEAVAHEFDRDELDANPEAIDEIIRENVAKTETADNTVRENAVQTEWPDWIANFVAGHEPLEIEPIDPVKTRQDAQTEYSRNANNASARRQVQHSTTLNRHFVKKPTAPASIGVAHTQSVSIATHPLVHKFDKFEIPAQPQEKPAQPIVEQAATPDKSYQPALTREREERLEARAVDVAKTGRELKDILINEQLSAPVDQNLSRAERKKAEKLAKRQAKTKRRFHPRTIFATGFAVLLIGGFLTYTQMPNISVRVAAARAGVDAANPYAPSGYSIDGPVAYAPGQVTINYKNNGGGEGYSFTQASSAWNSDAVRDNLVESATDDYETLTAGDLTIYRYGNNAAWVRGGVLYTLDGNDQLGDNQILEIADSI